MALVLALGLGTGGCALSYKLDSIFGDKESSRKDEITGSIAQSSFATAPRVDLFDADLAYTRAAVSEVLSRGGNDVSAPWENPSTGARGTVTPIASAYNQDGLLCRDFLASYVRAGAQAWLQGEACRKAADRWEVKSLKPLKSS